MAEASLKLGGSWATKEGSLLGFNDQNGNYKPIPFDFTRATTATRVNRNGLIEEVQSGVPRIDFTGDGSLLLEPQRTNLVPNSEDFSAGSWTKTNVSITSNATTSPEGIDNAVQITENTSGLNLYAPSDTLSGSASDYTYSVFLKEGSLRYGGLRAINNVFANRFFVNVDLQEGTVTDTETVGSGVTWTYGVESFSDGWYRVWITGTNTSGNIDIAVGLSNSATPNYASGLPYYTGTGSDYIYAYGAQLEVGNYPTSYIPTSGSAVTRVSEPNQLGKTDLITDGFFSSTELTWFIDINLFEKDSGTSVAPRLVNSSNGDIFIGLNETLGGLLRIRHKDGTTAANTSGVSFDENGQRFKVLIKISGTTGEAFINGSSVGTFTTLAASNYDEFENVSANAYDLRQMLMFPTALTDSECIDLTTI